jgi:L-lysine exporter family protein LysE/ArgO
VELFFLGAALAFSINIELGVVNVMIVRTAIDRGAWPAFLIGLGSCIGDLIWACAGALGVSVLLAWPPAAWILWLGGSAALCWFAAAALRDATRGGSIDESSPLRRANGIRAIGLGLGIALGSPTLILWTATVGGSVLASQAADLAGFIPFISGFGAAAVAHSAILSGVVGATRRFTGPRTVRAVSLVSALMFAAFAIGIFMDGARRLLLPLLG